MVKRKDDDSRIHATGTFCFLGSSTLFSALLIKCLEKEVIAVCRYTPRKSVPPYFVALVPQEEELDDQKIQVTPPGMWQKDFQSLSMLWDPNSNLLSCSQWE